MKKVIVIMTIVLVCGVVSADLFGTGANQFTIDFVNISGDASSANGTYIGQNKPEGFIDPSNDYRMGMLEITNDQFAKFSSNSNVYWTGADVSSNMVSWSEAAQFTNFLNTSTGNVAAYKFSGDVMGVWQDGENGYDENNPYRNSNAKYFMPTEAEWVKAAYWNGSSLQTYATKSGESLTQGDGTSGTGWNFYDSGFATHPSGPWNVGSGSEELNGTFDMMGNVWEWMENSFSGNYSFGSTRGVRGGSCFNIEGNLSSSDRYGNTPYDEYDNVGFRVASVPEPATLLLFGLGSLVLRRRRVI